MFFSEIFLRVATEKIALLKFILEGHDGLAQLSTITRKDREGLVRLYFPETRHYELLHLLTALAAEIRVSKN